MEQMQPPTAMAGAGSSVGSGVRGRWVSWWAMAAVLGALPLASLLLLSDMAGPTVRREVQGGRDEGQAQKSLGGALQGVFAAQKLCEKLSGRNQMAESRRNSSFQMLNSFSVLEAAK